MNPTVIRTLVTLRLLRVVRDRSSIIWLILMPMLFSFLMGNLLGDWSRGPADLPRCLVFAPLGDAEVDSLLAPLESSDRFRLDRRDSVVSEVVVRDWIERNRITAALYVPDGFGSAPGDTGAAPLRLFYDSDRLSSQTVRTLLEQSILRRNAVAAARALVWDGSGDELPGDRAPAFDEAEFARAWEEPRIWLESGTLGRVESEGMALTDAVQHVGPAYTIFFMLMFLMMTAKELVTERKDRTLARLITSRASTLDLVVGYLLGGMALGLLQTGILLTLNSLAFGIDYGESATSLVLVVVLIAGVGSAGSVLLGSVARSTAQADGLGMGVTMVMAALGGLWWPLEIVPGFMQAVGRALPTGQAITVFHDMIGRGYGLSELSGLLTGLAIWFGGLLVLAAWRLRRQVAV